MVMVKRRPGEIVQVNLRMREDLRQRLSGAAEKASRSFNAELVERLEESFKHKVATELLAEAMGLLKQMQKEALPLALAAAQEAARRLEKAGK